MIKRNTENIDNGFEFRSLKIIVYEHLLEEFLFRIKKTSFFTERQWFFLDFYKWKLI